MMTHHMSTTPWYSRVMVWRLVQVIKAGESADEDSRVCHAVL